MDAFRSEQGPDEHRCTIAVLLCWFPATLHTVLVPVWLAWKSDSEIVQNVRFAGIPPQAAIPNHVEEGHLRTVLLLVCNSEPHLVSVVAPFQHIFVPPSLLVLCHICNELIVLASGSIVNRMGVKTTGPSCQEETKEEVTKCGAFVRETPAHFLSVSPDSSAIEADSDIITNHAVASCCVVKPSWKQLLRRAEMVCLPIRGCLGVLEVTQTENRQTRRMALEHG